MKKPWLRRVAWATFLVVLVLVSPVRADERVDAAIATLRAQIPGIHDRIMIAISAHDEAWKDFKNDPTPVNEARINKLAQDMQRLDEIRTDLRKWLEILKDQDSMTINTLRQIMGQTQSAIDSAAEWARGVVPGATWILGVSQETLYNDRWKDTEAAFNAMSTKGAELRRRYQAILSDIQNKVSDTPENREELARLQEEIAIWKAKMQVVSEIYEFLRSDMPAEIIFWNELTGPYVKAFEDNIRDNLEEFILWDTLGGTSPAERLYKLFKPVIQMKLGEFFSDPVLTDKVRNVIVMEVLFAGAPLDRMLKTAETGLGEVLNNAGLQKAVSDLMGNRARRQELQNMLQQMSYDQIPGGARKYLGGAVPKPSGSIANFTISGLNADEVKRLQKVKNSKAVGDGIMKVASELVGPLLNAGAFRAALETAKQECATYRKVYGQLRAAKIIGAGTYVGIGGQAATSAEDNFVNECFEDPEVFAGYLTRLKEQRKGFDVAQYAIKETYRKKSVEIENDIPEEPEYIESTGYEENTRRLQEIWEMLWSNQIAASQVYPEVKNAQDGLWETYGKKHKEIKDRFKAAYEGKAGESCIWDYSGPMSSTWGCPADFLDTMNNEWKSYALCNGTFDRFFYEKYKQEIPGFVQKYMDLKNQAAFSATLMVPGKETPVALIKSQDANFTLDLFSGPDRLNDIFWWNGSRRTFQEEISRVEGVANEPGIPLKDGEQRLQAWIDGLDKTIIVLKDFLAAKERERETVLAACPALEEIATALGEHRNFYQYAQEKSSISYNNPTMPEGTYALLKTLDVDGTIQRLTGYEDRFSIVFDQRCNAIQELIERLEDRRRSVQGLAMVYSSSVGSIWTLFGQYHDLYEQIFDGTYVVRSMTVETISKLFAEGISTNQQGSLYIQNLLDELSRATLNDAQISFITSRGHDSFVMMPNVPPIVHPVLRSFVTPSLERVEKARTILWQDYAEQDALMQEYRQKEAAFHTIEDDLTSHLRRLRSASSAAAPAFSSMVTMASLQWTKKMKVYDVWPDLPEVESYHRIPDVLIKELNGQERGLIQYHALVDRITQNPPVSAEQVKAVRELQELARQVDEQGPAWQRLPAAEFSRKVNQITSAAYTIYEPFVRAGKAPPDGPVNSAYGEVLRKVNLLRDKVYGEAEIAKIGNTLRSHIREVEDFLNRFPAAGADPFPRISMLLLDVAPGSKADSFKDNSTIAGLIAHINLLIGRLGELQREQDASRDEVIRDFYDRFRAAYESRDAYQVMGLLSDEWSAGDGTTLDDLEENLTGSFRIFDDIRYGLQNLRVQPQPDGRYIVSYDVTITSRIYSRNLVHEEKSRVNEELSVDAGGKAHITRTLSGRFWTD